MPDRTIKMLEDHMSHLQKTIELMRAGKMKTQSFKDGKYVDTWSASQKVVRYLS